MTDKTKKPTQAEQLETTQVELNNLKIAFAKVATLCGYGNHLKEFNIDKWEPSKEDMQKKRG